MHLKKFEDAAHQAQHVVDDATAQAAHRSAAHEIRARIALGRRHPEVARAEAALAEEADAGRPVGAYERSKRLRPTAPAESARVLLRPAETLVAKNAAMPLEDLRLSTAETLQRLERLSEAEDLYLEELKHSPSTDTVPRAD